MCPAFAEAPARRTRLWQAGLREGRRNTGHFGVQARITLACPCLPAGRGRQEHESRGLYATLGQRI